MANVAVVSAGRGVGYELVKRHSGAGDRVFALCLSPETADKLNALVAAAGGKVTVNTADIADDASRRSGAADTGTEPIDLLYSVAGFVGTMEPELETAKWDVFDEAINIMLNGPLRAIHVFLPRLKSGSKVINFSSQVAASTWPYGGHYACSAAKAGLNRMMRSVAMYLKDKGIVIGIVHPGYVQTDMSGPHAENTPEESASGIRKVAAEWTLAASGDFKKWNGESHAR